MKRIQHTCRRRYCNGMSLIEAMLSLLIGAMLVASLSTVLSASLDQSTATTKRLERVADATFVLDRLERWIRASPFVLTPHKGNVATGIAFAIDPNLDSDGDGFADADNDRDGQSNEDPGADMDADGGNGWFGVDDDVDGTADETDAGTPGNDDEDGASDEDPFNGIDDDGDGLLDEDWGADMNGDGCPGACGIDEDGNGTADEGDAADDDEDGQSDEDWVDMAGIGLVGSDVYESLPLLGASSGTFRTNRLLLSSVDGFRIERVALDGARERIDIELELLDDNGGIETYTRSVTRQSP
ncbi:MAG: prepilin-type N-terminal cleavage/methylation domain-containing protein [Pseudomonadaceae bacterium]|nr:prepilin-type N-terminal cleavage/methylation domain-containing protein [Pseudomonadaceae bacterium]